MRSFLILVAATMLDGAAVAAPPSTIELSPPFVTRSAWRFTSTQGPDVEDPGGSRAPGVLRLCVSRNRGRSCQPDLSGALLVGAKPDLFAEPHYLDEARIVRPRPGEALLLLQLSSLHSGNGDQRRATLLLAYDRGADRFVQVYARQTGRNNDQDVRYIEAGPLAGDMIAAEPTADAPYGFWITVSRPEATGYRQALRYRSATRYGDGNPLPVIDSEIAGIERRLGIWHVGEPLPVPSAAPCARPHLVRSELWCR